MTRYRLPLLLGAGVFVIGQAVSALLNLWAVRVPIGTPYLEFSPGLLLAALAVGLAGFLWQFRAGHRARASDALLPETPRGLLIANVRAMWIAGVLERSLYREVQLSPGLRNDPPRVALPVRALVQQAGSQPEELPEGVRIADVYDHFGGALFILGQPGAGKTTLLLELAYTLLDRAGADPALPIPVVFPLSAWAAERKPLDQWLIDQLRVLHLVSRQQATAWVEQHQILPLLDGLDEVAEPHRPACVQAINAFREQRGTLPLVVCSRLDEYETAAQAAQLRLHGAVIVQPLRQVAVLETLAALGPEAQALRDALAADQGHWLWQVATTPLGLSMLIPAVQHNPGLLWAGGSDAERRDQIIAAYVDAMFARRAVPAPWSREETIRLLGWLASQMQARGQTVFLLEQLQPDWLPTINQREFALFTPALLVALSGALTGAVMGAAMSGTAAVVMALFLGLTFGVGFAVFGTPDPRFITLAERLTLSWDGAWSRLRPRLPLLLFQLPGGALAGLLFEVSEGLFGSLLLAAVAGLLFGLSSALTPALLLVLQGGSGSEPVVAQQGPNQGLRESARSGVISGLLAGLATALLSGLALGIAGALFFGRIGGLAIGLNSGLAAGLGGGLLLGVLVGLPAVLSKGVAAALQHAIVRLLLARANLAPLRYADFLNHAAAHVLLHRAGGGGWVFVHRLLLDYFASLAPGLRLPPPAPRDATPSPTSGSFGF